MSIVMTVLQYLGYVLIFPGFLFCFLAGMLLCGIDRKLVAKMQKRVGPPVLQPFYDFFKLCGKEMVPEFTRIMVETGVRDNFATRPASYFEAMLDNLGDKCRLYMAFHEGQPIAGTLAILYGDKVWYLYGASSNEHRNLMPNYLLQWSMIQWAIENNCRVYDFRGVSGDISEDNPHYGLYRFKKGFGGEFTEFVGEYDHVMGKLSYFIAEKGALAYKSLAAKLYMIKNRKKEG